LFYGVVTFFEERGSHMATPAQIIKLQIVSISVELGVTTPDNLRHIAFDLAKDTGDDRTVSWTIDSKLQERASATDAFIDIVTLTVKVKSKNNPAAEATASEGLSDAQATHLQGPAIIAAQQIKAGAVTEEQASRVIENTLPLHNA
jgi:hypothetical protein